MISPIQSSVPRVTITERYRALNRALHISRPDYGSRAHRWSNECRKWARHFQAKSFLDYGCGTASLSAVVPELQPWQNYDPAVDMWNYPPKPADLVVCLDVLEHIEPDCIDDVLDELRGLSIKACVMFVDTGSAVKKLPDGRNAHILQRPLGWWLAAMMKRWTLHTVLNQTPEFLFIGTP